MTYCCFTVGWVVEAYIKAPSTGEYSFVANSTGSPSEVWAATSPGRTDGDMKKVMDMKKVNKVKTVLVKTPEGEKHVSVPQGTKAVLQDPNAEACGSMRTAPRCVLSLRSRTTTLFERMRCLMESPSFRV